MRVARRTVTTFWAAHAWTGAITSVVVFTACFLGVFSLFSEELGPWQEPRLRHAEPVSADVVLEAVQREVDAQAAHEPARLDIHLPEPHAPWLMVWTRDRGGGRTIEWVEPATGERVPLRSDLGYFLHLMHFLFPIPGGVYVAGIAAIVLLFVVISGLIIQLNKLRTELGQFRPWLRLRLVWSDAHKVLGVIGLPFQLVVAWTGAVLCLQAVVGPTFVPTTLAGDWGEVERALALGGRGPRPAKEAAEAPDVRMVMARAGEALPHASPHQLVFRNLGDKSAFVDVRGVQAQGFLQKTSVRVARDGEVRFVREPGGDNTYSRTMEAFSALHFASYGDLRLRMVYALLALMTALCIVTGNLIWLERRRKRGHGIGDVVLARLTSGACAGVAVAVAALFVANQLLPGDLLDRVAWEHGAFFVAWGASVVYGLVRRSAAASARDLLVTGGALLAVVPLIDALIHHRLPFDPRAPWYLIGPDLGLLILGTLLFSTGLIIRKLTRSPKPRGLAHE